MGHFLQLLFESYTELLILIDESMISESNTKSPSDGYTFKSEIAMKI